MTRKSSYFIKSLKQFSETFWDDPEWHIRPFENEEINDSDIFAITQRAIAHAYVHKSLIHLERLITVCESPIEEMMLFALCIVCHDTGANVRYQVRKCEFGDLEMGMDSFQIEPQAVIEKYRVDCRLTYSVDMRQYDANSGWRSQTIIIECDGHAFHEKTPEQAQKDKERDRYLQKLGYRVFHYTGREIWRDVFKCAHEVAKSLQKSVGVTN